MPMPLSRRQQRAPLARPPLRTTLRALASVACAAMVLVACGSSPPTRLHAIEGVPAAAPPLAYAGAPLVLRSVGIPPTLDRLELVAADAGGQLRLREFDHWAAPLGRGARQALIENLALRLPPGKVVFPGAPRPPGAAEINVDVLSFRVSDGTARMWLSWTLRPAREASPPATAESTAANGATRLSRPVALPPATSPAGSLTTAGNSRQVSTELRLQVPAGDGAAAMSQAWSALFGQVADRIAAALTDMPAP